MAYEDLKAAIRKQYTDARGKIKQEGFGARDRAVSTAGRRAAVSGVTGPLRIAAESQAGTGAEKATQLRLGQQDIAESGAMIGVEQAKIAEEERARLAKEQVTQGIWSGIGGILGGLANLVVPGRRI